MADKDKLHLIKANIENLVGQKVRVTANRGRKRITVREGLLEQAYPNVFVVQLKNEFDYTRRASFTYKDVLTNTVELRPCASGDGEVVTINGAMFANEIVDSSGVVDSTNPIAKKQASDATGTE